VKLALSPSNSSDVISLAVIYRSPTTKAASPIAAFYDELSGLFDKLADASDGDRLVCCGDFNCGGDDATSVSPDMHAVFNAQGLQPFVQSPTRRTLTAAVCSTWSSVGQTPSESHTSLSSRHTLSPTMKS
jgi:hypothetical protein